MPSAYLWGAGSGLILFAALYTPWKAATFYLQQPACQVLAARGVGLEPFGPGCRAKLKARGEREYLEVQTAAGQTLFIARNQIIGRD